MEYEVTDAGHRIYDTEAEDDEEPEYTPTDKPATYDNDGEILIAFATGNAPVGFFAQRIYSIEPYDA